MEEYRRRYGKLVAPLDGIPKEVFLSQFINGLDYLIKAKLRLMNPITLSEAMDMATKIEVRNKLVGRYKSLSYTRKVS